MSTEIRFDPIACPDCNSMLLAERLDDVPVLCANCRTAFVPGGRRTIPRTSRRAAVSFVLGLLSLIGLFLTGIPAICLGALAIRDMRRSPRALKGKALAVGGIASGTVFGLMCGTCISVMGALIWAGQYSTTHTEEPQAIADIAARTADFEPPRGTEPLEAIEMGMIGIRTVVYGGDPRQDSPLIVVGQYPPSYMPQQAELQMQNQLRNEARRRQSVETVESGSVEMMIRGEAVGVSREIVRDNERGDRFREYISEIPSDAGPMFAGLITPDEGGANVVALTEAEVRAFFESFR